MAWKPDQTIPVCRLSNNINVEYEIYNDPKSFNRLEFRKGNRYLYELIEEDDQSLSEFLYDLQHVWSSNLIKDKTLPKINKMLLWLIGGCSIASSEKHDIKVLNRNSDVNLSGITKGAMTRNVSWTVYKLKRGNKISLVLFQNKKANSISGINQSSELSFNWIKLHSNDVNILLPTLEKLIKQ
jgi:hypothetical protein